ncbi:MBL fold metallo-hydrolase [Patescibacteria group bacterium]|nr:MBL fold metallo-hydrolase [Patescibacteria group bacterium]
MAPFNATTIKFLGQACVFVEAGDVRILSDPWFSGAAHVGSWIPFPLLEGAAQQELLALAKSASHIVLSHQHDDHFDLEFLWGLPPGKEILVGNFRSTRFRDSLLALRVRHRVTFLEDGEVHKLTDGVTLQLYLERPAFRTNSVIVIETPDGRIVNANDCGLDTAMLERIAALGPSSLFLYTLNFAANGYPFPYLRSDQPDRLARIQAVRDEIVAKFAQAMTILQPNQSIAFAGPVTFSDELNNRLLNHPEALDWRKMVAELGHIGSISWPAPGSVLELEKNHQRWTKSVGWEGFLEAAQSHQAMEAPTHIICTPWSDEGFTASVETFVQRRADLFRRLGVSPRTLLVLSAVASVKDVEQGPVLWHHLLNFGVRTTGHRRIVAHMPFQEPYLQITAAQDDLAAFMREDIDYDHLMLSYRARFTRVPDEFNSDLHNVLRFGHDEGASDALAQWTYAQQRAQPAATITVQVHGQALAIPAACPHEGRAWGQADVDQNERTITCPTHRWKFELDSGRCVVGRRDCGLYQLGRKP